VQLLSEPRQRNHIPYWDSNLTKILQNSLSGNSKTIIICTVNLENYKETINTLNFSQVACKVKQQAIRNELRTQSEEEQYITHTFELEQEI